MAPKIDIRKYYTNLGQLFQSGPPIRRKIANKVAGPGSFGVPIGTARAFLKHVNNAYASTIASYGQYNRLARYSDYNEMESMAEIGGALDIYAEEICTKDEEGELLKIYSSNVEIKKALSELFYNTLNIEFNSHTWVRNLCKYGDQFLLIDHHPDYGVLNALPMPINEVEREEGFDQENPLAYRYRWITQGNRVLENWQVVHFRLMSNDNFLPYGSCLKGDTRILTSNGIKEISEIEKGDTVISFDIKTQKKVHAKVLDQVCSGCKVCYRISTRHNFIDVSGEHKVAVYNWNSDSFEYKRVDDLKIGDRLVISKQHDISSPIKIDKTNPEENKNGWWNTIDNIPDHVDEEFARLFGFLIGDGWIPKHNNSVDFALSEKCDLNEFYIGLIEKFSGNKVVKVRPHHKSQTNLKYSQVKCNSKMLKTVFQRMGFKGTALTKRFPDWIFRASIPIKDAFLQGLFDADGSSFTDKWNCTRYQLELSNEQLIKDAKILIQSLGYKSGKIGERDRKEGFIREQKVNMNKSYYFYYFESRLHQTLKYDIYERFGHEYIIEPIIDINDLGEYPVYDIHVDNDYHNFFANGVLVHNSVLEPARRTWRQLILMEDAVMVYRIVRSPERRVFYIDVGNVSPENIPAYMQKVQTQLKRNQIVDSSTGRVDLRYNPLSTDEDYWVPTRGEHSSKIETLPGGQFTGDIDDLVYIQNKLFAALKIPKSYLGYEQDINAKSTLSQEDVRFARTIQRIQMIFAKELNRLAIIHLYSMGYRGSDLINFELGMANPSTISELQNLELYRTRFEVASIAQEGFFDRHFVYKKIFKLNDNDIESIEEGRRKDRMFDMELENMQPPTPPMEEMPPTSEIPPEGEEAPPEAPQPETPTPGPEAGLPPPPGEETPITAHHDPLVDDKDPNIQSAAPNDMLKPFPGKKSKILFPDLHKHAFGDEKTARDFKRNRSELNRMVRAPFGESVDDDTGYFKISAQRLKKFAEDLDNNPVLQKVLNEKKKKVLKD